MMICLCVCVCVCVWVCLCLCVSEEKMMRIKERSQFVLHKKERKKKDAKCEINKIWYTQAIVAMHIYARLP